MNTPPSFQSTMIKDLQFDEKHDHSNHIMNILSMNNKNNVTFIDQPKKESKEETPNVFIPPLLSSPPCEPPPHTPIPIDFIILGIVLVMINIPYINQKCMINVSNIGISGVSIVIFIAYAILWLIFFYCNKRRINQSRHGVMR